jgi:hypothetical protein
MATVAAHTIAHDSNANRNMGPPTNCLRRPRCPACANNNISTPDTSRNNADTKSPVKHILLKTGLFFFFCVFSCSRFTVFRDNSSCLALKNLGQDMKRSHFFLKKKQNESFKTYGPKKTKKVAGVEVAGFPHEMVDTETRARPRRKECDCITLKHFLKEPQ